MPWPATEVQLTENVRNTQQIAAALAALPGAEGTCRGLEAPAPSFESAPADTVLEVADQVVAGVVGSGLAAWRHRPADHLGEAPRAEAADRTAGSRGVQPVARGARPPP